MIFSFDFNLEGRYCGGTMTLVQMGLLTLAQKKYRYILFHLSHDIRNEFPKN
jgi:hypothetical protein